LNAEHVKSGLAGIWNDMNEPATGDVDPFGMRFDRDGENFPHERYHNQYAMLMAMGTVMGLLDAMPNLRTFVLSRAGFAGIQRYAANWMGDNASRWEHLDMSLPMALGLGVSGQPFVGADIGGFAQDCNPELLVRWTQCAAFTPFFRNHNCAGQRDQYPWAFGPGVEKLCKVAIEQRYRLLPYIYTSFMHSAETGAPVQRPLVFDFQSDRNTWEIDDQYLFGESLLIAPVLKPEQNSRFAYLPAGHWMDWYTQALQTGNQYVTVNTPLEHIGVFARAGAVIPMLAEAPQTTCGLQPESIDLEFIVPPQDGIYRSTLYEDDGLTFAHREGKYVRTEFTVTRSGKHVKIEAKVSGQGFPAFRRTQFRVNFRGSTPTAVRLGSQAVPVNNGSVVIANRGEGFVINSEF
jgi:alpha-glucosidase